MSTRVFITQHITVRWRDQRRKRSLQNCSAPNFNLTDLNIFEQSFRHKFATIFIHISVKHKRSGTEGRVMPTSGAVFPRNRFKILRTNYTTSFPRRTIRVKVKCTAVSNEHFWIWIISLSRKFDRINCVDRNQKKKKSKMKIKSQKSVLHNRLYSSIGKQVQSCIC